jgi:hypothetical protein
MFILGTYDTREVVYKSYKIHIIWYNYTNYVYINAKPVGHTCLRLQAKNNLATRKFCKALSNCTTYGYQGFTFGTL